MRALQAVGGMGARRRGPRARAAAAAFLVGSLAASVAPAYAASGDSTSIEPATFGSALESGAGAVSSPSATSRPTYSPPPAPSDAIAPAPHVNIKPSNVFHVKVDPKGKKPLDQTWPSATTLFTKAELAQALPGTTGVTASACHPVPVPGGGTSAHNETCTLTLKVTGEPTNDPSRLVVLVRGFGDATTIGRRWNTELTAARARSQRRPGLYTFYRNGALGAAASYTDGTTTHVLLARGTAYGVIWFSGVGFTTLRPTYLASRKAYRDVIIPELVRLLSAKMRGASSASTRSTSR